MSILYQKYVYHSRARVHRAANLVFTHSKYKPHWDSFQRNGRSLITRTNRNRRHPMSILNQYICIYCKEGVHKAGTSCLPTLNNESLIGTIFTETGDH